MGNVFKLALDDKLQIISVDDFDAFLEKLLREVYGTAETDEARVKSIINDCQTMRTNLANGTVSRGMTIISGFESIGFMSALTVLQHVEENYDPTDEDAEAVEHKALQVFHLSVYVYRSLSNLISEVLKIAVGNPGSLRISLSLILVCKSMVFFLGQDWVKDIEVPKPMPKKGFNMKSLMSMGKGKTKKSTLRTKKDVKIPVDENKEYSDDKFKQIWLNVLLGDEQNATEFPEVFSVDKLRDLFDKQGERLVASLEPYCEDVIENYGKIHPSEFAVTGIYACWCLENLTFQALEQRNLAFEIFKDESNKLAVSTIAPLPNIEKGKVETTEFLKGKHRLEVVDRRVCNMLGQCFKATLFPGKPISAKGKKRFVKLKLLPLAKSQSFIQRLQAWEVEQYTL